MALATGTALAQQPTEAARKEAARVFAQGEKAFAARDYALAASRFEEAYRLAPHPNAIWNDARALLRSGARAPAANAFAHYLRDAPPTRPTAARQRERSTTSHVSSRASTSPRRPSMPSSWTAAAPTPRASTSTPVITSSRA